MQPQPPPSRDYQRVSHARLGGSGGFKNNLQLSLDLDISRKVLPNYYTSRKSVPALQEVPSVKLKTLWLGAFNNLRQISPDCPSETPLGGLSFYVRHHTSFRLTRGD